MAIPRVIPCLLLSGNGLVKTVRFKSPKYVGDAMNTVRILNEKEVDELLFLDIDASRTGRGPRIDYLRDIASECFMPLGYGGGIRSLNDIEKVLHTGVEKVCLNQAVFRTPTLVSQAATEFGSQAVMVSMDIKRTLLGAKMVFSSNAKRNQKLSPVALARRVADAGAGELLVTSVDREGTRQGYDLDLVKEVASAVRIPVVAHGGAGTREHLVAPIRAGAAAVAAGTLFVFHGKHRAVLVTYPARKELRALFEQHR